jgi:hypothetical protein
MNHHRTINILGATFHYTGDTYQLPPPIMECAIEIFHTTPGKIIALVRDEVTKGVKTIVWNHDPNPIHGLAAIQCAPAEFEDAIEDAARKYRNYSDYEFIYNICRCDYLPLEHTANDNAQKWYYGLNRTFNIVHSKDGSCWVYEDDDTGYQSPLYPSTILASVAHFTQWAVSTVDVLSLIDDEGE